MSQPKKISTLVLVRHGQSQWNKENLFTGWKDPDLTDKGIEEAINAGQKIKQTNINFDFHYTSKLKRAQRTGNLIMKELGKDIDTSENEALNERDYGDLSGLNKDDARKKWGDEQVHIWRRSYDTPPPGGESLKNTAERVLPYFENIIYPELRNQKNILISAHGNSLRALIMYLDKISEDEIDEQVHIWRRSYDTPPPGGESLKNTAERVLPYFENIIYPELRNQKNILISAHGNSLRALIMYLDKISEDEIVKLEIATGQPIVYKLDEDLKVITKEIL